MVIHVLITQQCTSFSAIQVYSIYISTRIPWYHCLVGKKRGGGSKHIKIFKEEKLILKTEGVLKSGTHNLACHLSIKHIAHLQQQQQQQQKSAIRNKKIWW